MTHLQLQAKLIVLKGVFMPLPHKQSYTINDIYSLPDGQRAELIDGHIYMMAPPSTRHQRISNYISTEINLFIRSHGGNCEVFAAPFAVFLKDENEQDNYVEPDISVICDSEKLDEKGCHGAPDWIIEIVSPSSKSMDYGKKQALYLSSGVREYWIVDPIRETVMIYRSSDDWVPGFFRFGDLLESGIFGDFVMKIQ